MTENLGRHRIGDDFEAESDTWAAVEVETGKHYPEFPERKMP